MSIAVLVQVYDEVRRLAIAGGAVAGGDFRLKKLVTPLEQAGAKAPVFAKVAQAAQAVVGSNEKTASAALLELATLVNAILYTQGETGIAGELKPIETTDLGAQATQASARVLKPLLEALSSTGSGRLELVRDAVERGSFRDLRLVKPALNALDDPYPELADLIVDKVLPMYGKAILPELRAKLDIKGRAGHVHRLRLLHKLDPEGSRDVIRKALDEGSKEIRVAAIGCLDATGDDLVYLLEQAKSKAKDVRAAALRSLSGAGTSTAEVIGALKKTIDGDDLELLIGRIKQTRLPEIQAYVLAHAERQLADTLSLKDPKQQGPAIARLQQLVLCLEGRSDADAEAFLLRCFEAVPTLAKMKSTPSGQDFNELLAHVLVQGTPKMRRRLVASHKTLTGDMLPPAFEAASESMTPAAFYEEFGSVLRGLGSKRGKKGPDQERAAALASVLSTRYGRRYHSPWAKHIEQSAGEHPLRELDPRWLDAAVDAGDLGLVCELAQPGHAKAMVFLSEHLNDAKSYYGNEVLQTMVRVGHPGAADAVIDALKKHAKTPHYFATYFYRTIIPDLPKSAAGKFEALLPTLPEKMVDQLIDAVETLKNKPE